MSTASIMTEERNRVFIKALETGRGPDTFIWSGVESRLRKMSPYALDASRAYEEKVESLRVSRDPCAYCGSRGDAGCKHRRAL